MTSYFIRRFLLDLIPQSFSVVSEGGRKEAELKVRFNPFIYKLDVSVAPGAALDPRLILGTAVLVAAIERRVFSDAWPEAFFHSELAQGTAWARAAELDGALAGYLLASLAGGTGHVGNLAVAPEARRRGVARALLADLFARARASGVKRVTLEVRAANFAAQALYRAHGFRLAGLRRGYYRDTGEDALIMAWQAPVAGAPGPCPPDGPTSTSNPG